MKTLTRNIIFTAIAVYLTSLWNPGFNVSSDYIQLIKISLVLTVIFYFIKPLFKIILLPLNLFTFGLAGTLINIALFYFVFNSLFGIAIQPWNWGDYEISTLLNIILVSFSISFITSMLKYLL